MTSLPLALEVDNVRGEAGLSIRRSQRSARRLLLVVERIPVSIRAHSTADVVAEVRGTSVLDDRLQFVLEVGLVASFAVFVEVESVGDGDGRVVFSPLMVETLQLNDEDFWGEADLLVFSDIADLLAAFASVAFDRLVDVLLQVVGDGSLRDLGRECDGEVAVHVSLGPGLVTALAAGNDTTGDNLGEGFEGGEDSECPESAWDNLKGHCNGTYEVGSSSRRILKISRACSSGSA
jgi:hypothetical protein